MSNEFTFDSHYPGKQYWRGGPELLVDFREELKVYHDGLHVLGEHLSGSSFTKMISIGYSAPNLVNDMSGVINRARFPEYLPLTGETGWNLYSYKAKAQETYKQLGLSFDGAVLVDDFADTAKKALFLNDFILKPFDIDFNFAFLTATNDSVLRMLRVGIKPFVAVTSPSQKLIELLKMRKSPSMVS